MTAITKPGPLATEPQKNYLRKLASERVATHLGANATERVQRVNVFIENGLRKWAATEMISGLQRMPIDHTSSSQSQQVKEVHPDLTPGVYDVDGRVYVVKPNREKTRLYAKRLVEINSDRLNADGDMVQIEFVYDSGAIFTVKPNHKMSYDDAKMLTIRYGRCIVCGRRLKAGKSVEQGIGPVCRKSFA